MVKLVPARATAGCLGAGLFALGTAIPSAAPAKTFINYFQPTPTVCPVTSQTWGVSGVLPRDTCNGTTETIAPFGAHLVQGRVRRWVRSFPIWKLPNKISAGDGTRTRTPR